METGFITVVKVKYLFNDGNEMQGIELCLAPKVKKFIRIDRDNADLLKMMGNGLIDWYNRAQLGDDIVLKAYVGKDKLVTDNNIEVKFN